MAGLVQMSYLGSLAQNWWHWELSSDHHFRERTTHSQLISPWAQKLEAAVAELKIWM